MSYRHFQEVKQLLAFFAVMFDKRQAYCWGAIFFKTKRLCEYRRSLSKNTDSKGVHLNDLLLKIAAHQFWSLYLTSSHLVDPDELKRGEGWRHKKKSKTDAPFLFCFESAIFYKLGNKETNGIYVVCRGLLCLDVIKLGGIKPLHQLAFFIW